jgi:hypothetical protein
VASERSPGGLLAELLDGLRLAAYTTTRRGRKENPFAPLDARSYRLAAGCRDWLRNRSLVLLTSNNPLGVLISTPTMTESRPRPAWGWVRSCPLRTSPDGGKRTDVDVLRSDLDGHALATTSWRAMGLVPRYVLDYGKPILGICYGMQLLAHQLGGDFCGLPPSSRVGWATVDLVRQTATAIPKWSTPATDFDPHRQRRTRREPRRVRHHLESRRAGS